MPPGCIVNIGKLQVQTFMFQGSYPYQELQCVQPGFKLVAIFGVSSAHADSSCHTFISRSTTQALDSSSNAMDDWQLDPFTSNPFDLPDLKTQNIGLGLFAWNMHFSSDVGMRAIRPIIDCDCGCWYG